MQNDKNKKSIVKINYSSRSALITTFLLPEFKQSVKWQIGIVYYNRRFATPYSTTLFIDYFYNMRLQLLQTLIIYWPHNISSIREQNSVTMLRLENLSSSVTSFYHFGVPRYLPGCHLCISSIAWNHKIKLFKGLLQDWVIFVNQNN